jgi:3-oxoacyl-[acyl-carrier protein] reductase
MRFKDRVAVVTGASRGIGRATALKLAGEGAVILGVARGEAGLRETVAAVEAAGGRMKIYPCDISDTDGVARTVRRMVEEQGRIDILVNNAGITRDNLLLRISPKDWDEVLETNLKGAFNTCKAVLRPMLHQKSGRIINIASVVGIMGTAGQTNYAASKAGLIGFTKSLAKEIASRNITVNAVAPGFIVTDLTDVLSEDYRKQVMEAIPLKRFGEPEDIAEAVAYLASDAARYVTGHVLQVDGGLAM